MGSKFGVWLGVKLNVAHQYVTDGNHTVSYASNLYENTPNETYAIWLRSAFSWCLFNGFVPILLLLNDYYVLLVKPVTTISDFIPCKILRTEQNDKRRAQIESVE